MKWLLAILFVAFLCSPAAAMPPPVGLESAHRFTLAQDAPDDGYDYGPPALPPPDGPLARLLNKQQAMEANAKLANPRPYIVYWTKRSGPPPPVGQPSPAHRFTLIEDAPDDGWDDYKPLAPAVQQPRRLRNLTTWPRERRIRFHYRPLRWLGWRPEHPKFWCRGPVRRIASFPFRCERCR